MKCIDEMESHSPKHQQLKNEKGVYVCWNRFEKELHNTFKQITLGKLFTWYTKLII